MVREAHSTKRHLELEEPGTKRASGRVNIVVIYTVTTALSIFSKKEQKTEETVSV